MVKFLLESADLVSFEKNWTDFRLFAIQKHGDQRYDIYPYAYHLAMVETYLDEFGFRDDSYRAAAWLHDTVEDTSTSVDEINHLYGPRIAGMVWACTGEGENRKQRNESIYGKLAQFPDAAVVKVADRVANIATAYKTENDSKLGMYLKEWPEFEKNVRPLMTTDDIRKLHFWNSLCDLIDKAKVAKKGRAT